MRLEDFDYSVPNKLIAKYPANPRESARLLVVKRATDSTVTFNHHHIKDLPEILSPEDVIVLNDTRVIPARLFATTVSGGAVEVLLLSPLESGTTWECLVRPGRKVRPTLDAKLSDGTPIKICKSATGYSVSFPEFDQDFYLWLSTVGAPPIPHYLDREANHEDWERYQTVYAKHDGAVAAPTAGLHFSKELINTLEQRGVRVLTTTLHVGYGTFSTLTEERLQGSELHAESFSVPPETLEAVAIAQRKNKRVVCVGTTSLRALESAYIQGNSGKTRLFIKPGYIFNCATSLLTNFHLPRTSLLVLVSSFLGLNQTKRCYEEAIERSYRFYSFGDAMLVI